MQIVDSRSWSAVTGACLTVSKQVFNSLVLLVDNKLEVFCSYLHTTMPLQLYESGNESQPQIVRESKCIQFCY